MKCSNCPYLNSPTNCLIKCSERDELVKPNQSVIEKKIKAKKCRICQEKFIPKNISTEVICEKYDCKVTYAMQIVEKQRVAKNKEIKKTNIEQKKKLKDAVTNWKSELQTEINLVVS